MIEAVRSAILITAGLLVRLAISLSVLKRYTGKVENWPKLGVWGPKF